MVQWNVYHQDKWTNEMYIIKTNGPMKCISSRQMDQWNVYHQDKWINECLQPNIQKGKWTNQCLKLNIQNMDQWMLTTKHSNNYKMYNNWKFSCLLNPVLIQQLSCLFNQVLVWINSWQPFLTRMRSIRNTNNLFASNFLPPQSSIHNQNTSLFLFAQAGNHTQMRKIRIRKDFFLRSQILLNFNKHIISRDKQLKNGIQQYQMWKLTIGRSKHGWPRNHYKVNWVNICVITGPTNKVSDINLTRSPPNTAKKISN